MLGVDFMSENVRAILDEAGHKDVKVYRMAPEEIGCSLAEAAESPAYDTYLAEAGHTPNSLHVRGTARGAARRLGRGGCGACQRGACCMHAWLRLPLVDVACTPVLGVMDRGTGSAGSRLECGDGLVILPLWQHRLPALCAPAA